MSVARPGRGGRLARVGGSSTAVFVIGSASKVEPMNMHREPTPGRSGHERNLFQLECKPTGGLPPDCKGSTPSRAHGTGGGGASRFRQVR